MRENWATLGSLAEHELLNKNTGCVLDLACELTKLLVVHALSSIEGVHDAGLGQKQMDNGTGYKTMTISIRTSTFLVYFYGSLRKAARPPTRHQNAAVAITQTQRSAQVSLQILL